ncbi:MULTISPECIES: transporter substrate-binding domain-containing protein [unclassified Variovorax]|uniref:transporter substrate-binding domain-containing protein n=1 Tax=unclassified Variovorax TaxID=663243 RepID=UPI00076CE472|nr:MULTISPECIES: transporter substrate-binding domain-containing protein [unclassified Variovorax]KWT83669.1 extracellular solute-binding protein, family 3 [Variovorax sp. WDL1]PNG52116.1 L-cystine-binding protein FliY [Variovorax sp. B4]PNG54656.1 L-cystine-binding protein FliY [Variovorax sp. B2]VTV15638.1 Sulfate starvation-induced protein 7 [Variovorax sp. WDL1]
MTFFTTRRAAIAALGLGAALTAFAPLASAQTVADIKKKGEVTIGMLVDFPPYGTTNAQNQPDGYDADVAKLLAKDWGVKANIVPVTGPNRIPFLLTNKVDLLVASLAVTPERAKQVQFSQPYAAATIVLYGKKGSNIKSAADLKGVRVGVARASTQDVAVTKAAPEGTEIRRFDDDASAMQALISGQVDAIGCSVTVAAQIAKRVPADTFENKFTLVQQAMAIAMRPGQDDLLKNVNEFVSKNTANGELNKLYNKWLQTDLPKLN